MTTLTRREKLSAALHLLLVAMGIASAILYVMERSNYSVSRERFSEALEAADAGQWYLKIDTGELYWDEHMFRLFGAQREGWSADYAAFEKRLHPDDRERVRSKMETAIADRGGYNDIFRVIAGDGEIREIRAAAMVSRDGRYMTGLNLPVKPRAGNFKRERGSSGSGLPYLLPSRRVYGALDSMALQSMLEELRLQN